MNCQGPIAPTHDFAIVFRPLSAIARYFVSSGTPCSAKIESNTGKYIPLLGKNLCADFSSLW